MPTGPQGENSPADTVGCAVKVMRIATGEIEEALEYPPKRQPNREKSGRPAPPRARSLSPERRTEIAAAGAAARWGKSE